MTDEQNELPRVVARLFERVARLENSNDELRAASGRHDRCFSEVLPRLNQLELDYSRINRVIGEANAQ